MSFFYKILFFFLMLSKWNYLLKIVFFLSHKKVEHNCIIVSPTSFFLIYRKKRSEFPLPHIPFQFHFQLRKFFYIVKINLLFYHVWIFFGLLFLLLLLYAVGIKYKRKDEKIRWYITNIFFLLIFSALSHFLLIARSLFKANMEYTFNKKPHLMYY